MMAANDYAVLVGISRYPGLGDLDGPVNDAKSFQEWLLRRGGVPPGNIKFIVTPNNAESMTRENAQPLRDQVVNALIWVLEKENEQGKVGRRLYLYLAGHGYGPQVNDAALLMANAGGRSFPAVPGIQFANWFRAAAKFEEIVLIMDCCRDDCGALPSQSLPWADENSPDAANVRYFYAFATQTYRKAREQALPPDGMVRGIFTYALLSAFELALPEAGGCITGSAVKNYVLNFIKDVIGIPFQEPEIPIDSAKDIVLWKTDEINKLTVEICLGPACRGGARIIDGDLEIVWSGSIPDDGFLRLELTPGKYRIDSDNVRFAGKRFVIMGGTEGVIHVDL